MNLYHRTYAAEAIVRDGFHDGKTECGPLHVDHGVWVTDRPIDEQDGALGNVVLVVSGVPEATVVEFEWHHADGPRSFREFIVPAVVLNRFPIVGIYPDTWLWMSGEFEYVGSLIDMRPLLAKAPSTDGPGGGDQAASASSELGELQDH